MFKNRHVTIKTVLYAAEYAVVVRQCIYVLCAALTAPGPIKSCRIRPSSSYIFHHIHLNDFISMYTVNTHARIHCTSDDLIE